MSKKVLKLSQEAKSYLAGFPNLDGSIMVKHDELDRKSKEIGELEKDIEGLFEIQNALSGLGVEHQDPGKHGAAYYFVKHLEDDNIIASDTPSLTAPCDYCPQKHPVLMSYVQAYDSPEGDTWMKEAFVMCPTALKTKKLMSASREHRF